jgi:putative transcriptional regulator
MSERDIGREILEGIKEVKAYKMGKIDLRTHKLKESSSPRKDMDDLASQGFV